jgi:uncharacterized protein (TIGR02246 family)
MTRIGIALIVIAMSVSYATTARSDQTREAIESRNREFVAAFTRGDAEAVAGLYTEEGKLLPPGAADAEGRPAIAAFWKGAIDAGLKVLALETVEVESSGDLAYEVGTVKLTSGDGQVSQDRYLVVWKRENGEWRLHRDIWN